MEAVPKGHLSGRLHDAELISSVAGAHAFIGNVLEASTEYSIIAIDSQGVIVLWNEGARRLYGYDSGEIVGRHKAVLHVERDARSGMPQAMMDHASEHGKWEGIVDRVRKDGTGFTARVVMTRRCTEDGQPIGFLLMSSDITDELRKLHELEEAKRMVDAKAAQLETALRYKTEFFSNMSHELRTPLNSMLILAGILSENSGGTLTAEEVGYARAIHASGSDLLGLLKGILDLAQVSRARPSLRSGTSR